MGRWHGGTSARVYRGPPVKGSLASQRQGQRAGEDLCSVSAQLLLQLLSWDHDLPSDPTPPAVALFHWRGALVNSSTCSSKRIPALWGSPRDAPLPTMPTSFLFPMSITCVYQFRSYSAVWLLVCGQFSRMATASSTLRDGPWPPSFPQLTREQPV